MEKYPGKRILGLLIVEGDSQGAVSPHWVNQCTAQYEQEMLNGSLPHRSVAERDILAAGILGVTTWQALCATTGVSFDDLPDHVV
jgi:hypothetical protein